jgi:hypothetical protein
MDSIDLSTWTKEDLLKELSIYFDLIYREYPCYSVRDMLWFEHLEYELDKRGINWVSDSRITFKEAVDG